MNSPQELIQEIRAGNDAALENLYIAERSPFLAWARKHFKCSDDDAKELYQIIVLIAYDNIIQGRLKEMNCSMKSYLYAIAKNKWKEWQRARNKIYHFDKPYFSDLLHNDDAPRYSEAVVSKMYKGLQRLGNPCRKLLEAYYYQKLSMTEIAKSMGYKNQSTTKNLKYKCLQRLKKMLARNPNKQHDVPQSLSK